MKLSAITEGDGRMSGVNLLPESEAEAFLLEHLAALCGEHAPVVPNGGFHDAVRCVLHVGRHPGSSGMNVLTFGAQIVPAHSEHPACKKLSG
jgi:hypothetical protein